MMQQEIMVLLLKNLLIIADVVSLIFFEKNKDFSRHIINIIWKID
jgi:hypothetical protein